MNLKKNDILKLEITKIVSDGHGLARLDDFVIFVPNTAIGDVINAKILKVNKSHAYAKIEEILIPSPARINSDCNAFPKCGGCDFRHISYESEVLIKNDFIKDAFSRIGGLNPYFSEFVENPSPQRYRNKAQYPIKRTADGKIIFGFNRANSHDIIPCMDCKLHDEIFSLITDCICKLCENEKISIYNEEKHEGVLRYICLRKTQKNDVHITLVARRNIPEFKALARKIKDKFKNITGITLNINKEKTNVIFDYSKDDILLLGERYLYDEICGIKLRLSPKAFYQVNPIIASKIYENVLDNISDGLILDLYSGNGIIGLIAAKKAAKVIAVEINHDAVNDGKANAELNSINNIEFIESDVKEAVDLLRERNIKPDVIILDPARKGCNAVREIAEFGAEKIIMVSCNPATAARDVKLFTELQYEALEVKGFDMFSGTRHVECVILMTREND